MCEWEVRAVMRSLMGLKYKVCLTKVRNEGGGRDYFILFLSHPVLTWSSFAFVLESLRDSQSSNSKPLFFVQQSALHI